MITLNGDKNSGYVKTIDNNLNYKYCQNADNATCNWLLPANSNEVFCGACRLNRTIPVLTEQNMAYWKRIEVAKHRLVYSLIKLGLPIEPKIGEEEKGLAFDFMGDDHAEEHVMTGHDNGLITLNIEEADEVERTQNKEKLGEVYRTLLGHFRHEIGHYYWDVLLKYNQSELDACRKVFGDETRDYDEALKEHYKNGAPANWMDNFVSQYATSHPWEDWAETWANYMHMMDTLETAMAFGISIAPKKAGTNAELEVEIDRDPYQVSDFDRIVEMWLPLTFALNSLNRGMGHPDFYPFFISKPLIEKLRFIHELCYRYRFGN